MSEIPGPNPEEIQSPPELSPRKERGKRVRTENGILLHDSDLLKMRKIVHISIENTLKKI